MCVYRVLGAWCEKERSGDSPHSAHEKIGKGKIGLEAFRRIVNHPKLRDLPFYLETPCDLQGYKEEIALLKSLVSS